MTSIIMNASIESIYCVSDMTLNHKTQEICSICRCDVMSACNSCNDKIYDINTIVVGTCSHTYHRCCIDTYLKNNNKCPNCKKKWVVKVNNMTECKINFPVIV